MSCLRRSWLQRVEGVAGAGQVDRDRRLDPPGAGGEDHHPVGERHRLVDVVGDEQDRGRGLAPDIDEKALHLRPRLDVEGGEGLVHQEHLRPHREGPRHRHPLAHAARELVRALVGGIAQPHRGEHLLRHGAALVSADALEGEAERDVLPDRQPGEERGVLEDQRALRRRRGDRLAVEAHLAGRRLLETGDQIEQRALAAAGGPEKDDELAGRHLEVDVGESERRTAGAGIPGLPDAEADQRRLVVADGLRISRHRDSLDRSGPSKASGVAAAAARSRRRSRSPRSRRW